MGQDLSERNVERTVPTAVERMTRGASFGGLHDDKSLPLPPPAVGLISPVSPTSLLASHGLLTDQAQDSSSSRDEHIIRKETLEHSPRTNSVSTEASRSPIFGRENMHRYPIDNNEPSETTSLLTKGHTYTAGTSLRRVSATKDEPEVEPVTTSKTEFLILIKSSLPLMVSCILQYSLSGASVIAVGHLGKTELGAVSLAIMTSNVTGYCAYAGLATSLDTLCAQAYGSGKPHLVGLQLQRMVYFLWIITIPIAAVWLAGTQILLWITPERECAELAGLFLKVLVLGAPGFASFEAGKRFLQAQGLFNAVLYILLICAPINAFLNWFFVWVRSITPSSCEKS
jgi:MatE